MTMLVHVLLYEAGTESEGIHSLELKGSTVILMFQDRDDAERYCGLLEAQDFPIPSVEIIEQEEIKLFCTQAGYEARLVVKGFLPKTEEERFLISPPQRNLEVESYPKNTDYNEEVKNLSDIDDLDNIRKNLEKLI